MSLESPNQELLSSQKELLTPEVIEILRNRYEQTKTELLRENMDMIDKTGQIQSPELQRLIKARLGLIPVSVAGLEERLHEVEISLN
jgi:hypothetical protein